MLGDQTCIKMSTYPRKGTQYKPKKWPHQNQLGEPMGFNWVTIRSMGDSYSRAGMTQKQVRTEKLIAIWMMTHEHCMP